MKALSSSQRAGAMRLRDRFRAEGLKYESDWLYVATLNDAGKLPAGFKASSPVATVKALQKAGVISTRERATGHRDGRKVLEAQFTPRGADLVLGRSR